MEYDEFVSKYVGESNSQQIKIFALLCLIPLFLPMTNMIQVFVAAIPDHWCKAPSIFSNISADAVKALLIPYEDGIYSKCKMYDVENYTSMLNGNITLTSLGINTSQLPTVTCQDWEYDMSDYPETIVTKWDLVCENAYVAASPASIIGISQIFSSVTFGYLSDRFGRRKIILCATFLRIATGVASAFAFDPISYVVVSFFSGFANGGVYNAMLVLSMEVVGARRRLVFATFVSIFWGAGYVLLAGVAYFVRHWFVLTLVCNVPIIVVFLLFVWLLPESPRWLLQIGRREEARKILLKISSSSNVTEHEFDKAFKNTHDHQESTNPTTIGDILKSRLMLSILLINTFLWLFANGVYFGLSYGSSNLAGNDFANFAISGGVEIVAYVVSYWLLMYAGRRWTTMGCFLMAGVFLLLSLAVPSDIGQLVTAFAMIGKFAISTSWGVLYVYSVELFPTTTRNFAVGFLYTVSNIGGTVAPYAALLGSISTPETPLVIFGVCSLISGLVVIVLPETMTLTLPDTMEDTERFHDTVIPCVACCMGKRRSSPQVLDKLATSTVYLIEDDVIEKVSTSM